MPQRVRKAYLTTLIYLLACSVPVKNAFLLIQLSDSQRELQLRTQFHQLRSNRFESFRFGYKFFVVCGAVSCNKNESAGFP